jgi:hypothetical protein
MTMKNGFEIRSIIEDIEKLEALQTALNAPDASVVPGLCIRVDGRDWWIPEFARLTIMGNIEASVAWAIGSARHKYEQLVEESLSQ